MIEVWKPIKNWEKFYEVSNLGNVRNIKTNKLLTGDINNCGYYRVCLHHKNKKKSTFDKLYKSKISFSFSTPASPIKRKLYL